MRRSDFPNKVNRNNNLIYNRNTDVSAPNVMRPDFFVDQIWVENAETTSGIQIIELKSDGSEKSDQDTKGPRPNSGWSYDSHEHIRQKQSAEVNQLARERRRMRLEADAKEDYYARIDNEYGSEYNSNFMYTDFYSGDNNESNENIVLNHQMNCFTILDKHFRPNTDSSDESYENIDIMNLDESTSEQWNRTEQYDRYVNSYDPESEMEKRTVWIYSFKNKRLLGDNDFDLVNIPSQGTISTNSIDEDSNKPQADNACTRRAATPIPGSYIPRMNLSLTPTLPTVTEVTEPRLSTSDHKEKSPSKMTLKTKLMNTWFLSETGAPKNESSIGTAKDSKLEKSKNVVNWMALSPRMKKLRFTNISTKSKSHPVLDDVPEVISFAEKKIKKPEVCDKESQTSEVSAAFEISRTHIREEDPARISVGVFCNLPSGRITINDSFGIDGETDEELTPQDRGDHNRSRLRDFPPNLKIRFSPKPLAGRPISDPIENPDAKHWIGEEKCVQTNTMTAECYQRAQGEGIPRTLLIRNMSLLKPAEWAAYLPISESMPSLQLSSITDAVDDPLPWYIRLFRSVLRCCK